MTARLRELAARRDSLIVEAQMQRDVLAQAAQAIHRRLAAGDRIVHWLRSLQRKPLVFVLGTATAAILLARPARAVKWIGYLYSGYSLVRTLTRLLARTSQPR
jgi:hypothetical protein